MKDKVTVSAPGKLMLLGEHAVVYDRPCLVTAIDWRIKIKAERTNEPVLKIEARDIGLKGYEKPLENIKKSAVPKEAKFIEVAVGNFFEKYKIQGGIKMESKSEFSSKFGLGSSSATIACTIKALSELFGVEMKQRDIFDLSYKTILDIQGKGSGFDAAAAVYGGTLYFITGGKTIEPIGIDSLPLIVAYSGIKDDTATLIRQVSEKAGIYPNIINGIYNQIAELVESGKTALKNENWRVLGELMNFNQGYLKSLGVSTKKLSDMIYAAIDAGAWGSKLSGAGGGDCIIALAPENKRNDVQRAVKKVGGKIIKIKTNAPGVRVE